MNLTVSPFLPRASAAEWRSAAASRHRAPTGSAPGALLRAVREQIPARGDRSHPARVGRCRVRSHADRRCFSRRRPRPRGGRGGRARRGAARVREICRKNVMARPRGLRCVYRSVSSYQSVRNALTPRYGPRSPPVVPPAVRGLGLPLRRRGADTGRRTSVVESPEPLLIWRSSETSRLKQCRTRRPAPPL